MGGHVTTGYLPTPLGTEGDTNQTIEYSAMIKTSYLGKEEGTYKGSC